MLLFSPFLKVKIYTAKIKNIKIMSITWSASKESGLYLVALQATILKYIHQKDSLDIKKSGQQSHYSFSIEIQPI